MCRLFSEVIAPHFSLDYLFKPSFLIIYKSKIKKCNAAKTSGMNRNHADIQKKQDSSGNLKKEASKYTNETKFTLHILHIQSKTQEEMKNRHKIDKI